MCSGIDRQHDVLHMRRVCTADSVLEPFLDACGGSDLGQDIIPWMFGCNGKDHNQTVRSLQGRLNFDGFVVCVKQQGAYIL